MKQANEAGLTPEDIRVLVAKEEERHKFEGEEGQREREFRKLELEEADTRRAHELTIAAVQSTSERRENSEMFSKLKLPQFQEGEDEIDDFLIRFESLAEIQGWERKTYHIYLGSSLSSKALKVSVGSPQGVLEDFDWVKEALLRAYSVDADYYRRKFRESSIKDNESYVQLLTRMRQYLGHWVTLSEVEETYEGLFEFDVLDQLKTNSPNDLRVFLSERTFIDSLSMAQAADKFRSAHGSVRKRSTVPTKNETSNPQKAITVKCHLCHKPGHIRPNYPELHSLKPKTSQKVTIPLTRL